MHDINWPSSDDDGYSLNDAARLLNVSVSTISRRLADGELSTSARPGRTRVSAASVHDARKALAGDLHMHVEGNCVGRAEYDELLQQNLDLQAVIDDLRTVVASLNDALGRAVPRRIPTDR